MAEKAAKEATKEATEEVAKETKKAAAKMAEKLFENDASFEMVRDSIDVLSEEELRSIYNNVKLR